MLRGRILVQPGRGRGRSGSITMGVLAAGACWLLLAACGGGASGGANKVSATAQPAAATTPSTAAAATTPSGPLVVAIRSATLGTILADARDMVLYTYTADAGGRDGCTGACLKYWPPLLLPGGARAAVAGAGVTGLGIVQRPAGAQVTFEGKPLYTYLGDSRPGETSGQGIVDSGGTWYVAVLKAPVAATGTKPAQPAATTSPATPTPATTTRRGTAPPATHQPMTPAPTMATTPAVHQTPPPTMAPVTAPPVTRPPTTPPTRRTPPPTTVPATTVPGGGVSY